MMPDFVRLAGIADFLVWGVPPPVFMEVHEYLLRVLSLCGSMVRIGAARQCVRRAEADSRACTLALRRLWRHWH
jgi:hypothetical protein